MKQIYMTGIVAGPFSSTEANTKGTLNQSLSLHSTKVGRRIDV